MKKTDEMDEQAKADAAETLRLLADPAWRRNHPGAKHPPSCPRCETPHPPTVAATVDGVDQCEAGDALLSLEDWTEIGRRLDEIGKLLDYHEIAKQMQNDDWNLAFEFPKENAMHPVLAEFLKLRLRIMRDAVLARGLVASLVESYRRRASGFVTPGPDVAFVEKAEAKMRAKVKADRATGRKRGKRG